MDHLFHVMVQLRVHLEPNRIWGQPIIAPSQETAVGLAIGAALKAHPNSSVSSCHVADISDAARAFVEGTPEP